MGKPQRYNWLEFASPAELAEKLAVTVADRLAAAIAARGRALLALSGGTTPALFFRRLADLTIEWRKVTLTLVDERFVPATSDRSNMKLLWTHLLGNRPQGVEIIPLWRHTGSVEEAASRADEILRTLPLPLDVVVLGMGTDGHTASFFPDAPNVEELVDPEAKALVMPVHSPSGGEPRVTLTMPLIAGARFLALHIEGADKRRVFEHALAATGVPLPIRRVFDASSAPLHVYWAPKQDAKP